MSDMLLSPEENPYNPDTLSFIPRGSFRTQLVVRQKAAEVGAKAQLEKVYEWGNEICIDKIHTESEGTGIKRRRHCARCWQSLRQALKEGGE